MEKHIGLSNSEWIVMERLWQRPHTLMELVSDLGESVGWSKSTVATMLRRMDEKGIISYVEQGRAKLFHPAVTKAEVTAKETKNLLQRAYNGSLGLLVNAMIQNDGLTRADIDELYEVLRKAEEGK